MQRISDKQWQVFIQACQDLEAVLLDMPVDYQNLETVFQGNMGGQFVDGQSATTTLIADPAFNEMCRQTGIHFVAMACGMPQSRDDKDQPTLAIKIVDTRREPIGMILEYDIWPDGRRSLETGNLRLHVNDELSGYTPINTIVPYYRSTFANHGDFVSIAHEIVAAFPATGERTIAAQKRAVEEWDVSYG